MGRFGKSVVYGALFAAWLECFNFGFSVLSAAYKGEDVATAAGQAIMGGFVLWFICSFVSYELQGWVAERNKPRDSDERHTTADPDKPENHHDRHFDGM